MESPDDEAPSEVVSYVERPPAYIIDLSLPPEKRYDHLVDAFREDLKGLESVYERLMSQMRLIPKPVLSLTSRMMFRHLYCPEEDREIEGIGRATGISHYLLVAFNVLLDLFMGCTSGGVRVRDETGSTKMLHFRTLDWGMDELRKLVVELNFVEHPDGPIIATSVTYFGYVGVLTGLRKGLSLSLNFRPTHDQSSLKKKLSFRAHQVLVLLGLRRSIASSLRQVLLPKTAHDLEKSPREIAEALAPQESTACYLTFSDGNTTVCMDNDHKGARIVEADDFIFLMNHDYVDEMTQKIEELRQQNGLDHTCFLPDGVLEKALPHNGMMVELSGAAGIVEFSIVRRECMNMLWTRDRVKIARGKKDYCVAQDAVFRWMEEGDELVNGETHFAVIMDPKEGEIVFSAQYTM